MPRQRRQSRYLLGVAPGLAAAGVAAITLASCMTREVAPERAIPADAATLEKITLAAPGQGDVLIWQEDPSDPARSRYVARPAAEFPIELRTVGCIGCHEGQKEPHRDDLSFNLERMIGCTDCHGGIGWITTGTTTELEPILRRFLADVVGEAEPADLEARLARFERIADRAEAKRAAHVHAPSPATRERWAARRGGEELSSGNPEASGTMTLAESWEWIRFVNPGDLRVASVACGTAGCHGSLSPQKGDDIVLKMQKSMMTTSPMLWGAALYNNGAYPEKTPRWGESYGPHGEPQSVHGDLSEDPGTRAEELLGRGELARLDPLPRFEVGHPGNILRVFERGGRRPFPIGLPTPGVPGGPLEDEPGRPLNRLSQRGLGTLNRTDPVWLGLQRTRLMDPTLNFPGTNDQPGDYRASGCTGCHMVYANSRDPLNDLRADGWGMTSEDAKYARYAQHMGPYRYTGDGRDGTTPVLVQGGRDATDRDATIPADEPGHPIRHELTVRIPSAQCVVCHMHPGTAVENSYLGYMWWDLETDAEHLYPEEQVRPSPELELEVYTHAPEGSTPRRVPPLPADIDPELRAKLLAEAHGSEEGARDLYYRRVILGEQIGSAELNAALDNMQLGDFKGHGFLFRAVWKRDAEGNLQRARALVSVADEGRLLWVVSGKPVEEQDGRLRLETDQGTREVVLPADLQPALAGVKSGEEVTLLCRRDDGATVAVEVVQGLLEGRLAGRAEGQLQLWRAPDGEVVTVTLPADEARRAALSEQLAALPEGSELTLLVAAAEGGPEVRHLAERKLDLTPGDPDWDQRWKVAVHLQDIHLERGMHCIDCHYGVDNHGDGNLYGEMRAATAIKCEDCHGTVDALASLRTSGNAGGQDLLPLKVRGPSGSPLARFEWRYPNKQDRRTGEWEWKEWDPTKERTAYRAPEAKLFQRSLLYPELEWEVPQIMHMLDPGQDELAKEGKVLYRGRSRYNALAHVAKTMRTDGSWGEAPARRWGGPPREDQRECLAHGPTRMECYTCHTSWMTSCFGCHLDMKANQRRPALHNEGEFPRRESPFLSAGPKSHAPFFGAHPEEYQRNWTTYSFQTLRTDFFMLGRDGDLSGGKIVPVRSACAVTVGSQNQNRENIYSQQQTISAEGFSGTAFSPHFPHTVRTAETRGCNDCHVSADGDNNARLAQTLLLGSNAANFIGRFCYVAAGGGGFDAVVVTEKGEPQAVIGSRMHSVAWPDEFARHQARGKELTEAYHHGANTVAGVTIPFGGEEVLSVQLRGEYLYTANGTGGLKVYDVAQIDQKGFSERIVTAPVSPLGQRLEVDTKYATSVRAPSTQAVDPTRNPERLDRPQNREQKVHLAYAFLYVTDLEEGLILVGAGTLLDGDPRNNFLERAVTFNPGGLLKGARDCFVVGHHVLVSCDAGLVVVDVDDPFHPRVVGRSAEGAVSGPGALDVQFQYAFVCDREGLKVLDLSPLLLADAPAEGEVTLPLAGRFVAPERLPQARSVYVSRAYGYLAGGPAGLVVLDLSRPTEPRFVLSTNEGGAVHANDVKIAATNASMYAYVASGGGAGRDGLFVFQLTGNNTPDDPYAAGRALGANPTPEPRWISFRGTSAPALAVSEGIDRDRAVDEGGHQTAVFGRIGARPLLRQEMLRLLRLDGGKGALFAVPNLRDRAPDLEPSQRALRRREVEDAFGQGPFRRREGRPAVAWPEK